MPTDFSIQLQRAVAGDADAQFAVAEALRQGMGVDKNLSQALRWYREAAEQGHVLAQNNLGSMLLNGMGTDKNPAEATIWYRKAAEQGEAVAQFNLALRHLHGTGAPQSDTEAADWLKKAAEQGYAEAVGQLGTLCRFGRGIPQNFVRAAELHTLAALEGDVTSIGNLADYHEEIERAALRGSVIASLCLAKMHDRGLGVEKDPAQVHAWLRWAERHGVSDNDEDAMEELEDMEEFYNACTSDADVKRGKDLLKAMAQTAAKYAAPAEPSASI
ncbi:tetratricopeptide repeat protein [Ralstonia sp.]|uniref:tetratricopeptide repeat protein n=1 Tax=Ralstonia sp. TaxID=54061 RepID=UPI0031D2027B